MLSILIKYYASELEGPRDVIYTAETVQFSEVEGLTMDIDRSNTIHLSTNSNNKHDRDVFVMNDQGHTIARYCF